MGNKPTAPGGTQGPRVNQNVSGIIREGRPSNGVARQPRPTSAPIVLPQNITQTPDPNFSLRAREKAGSLISGHYYGSSNQVNVSNPNLSKPQDIYNDQYESFDYHYLQRGIAKQVNPDDLEVYKNTLDQVTSIWPEYNTIRDINFENLSPAIRNTLQQILKRLSEQHETIKELSEREHRHRQELVELKEDRNTSQQLMRRRDNEIRGLKEDVQLLRADLLSKGHEIRLPLRQHRLSDDLDGSSVGSPPLVTPDARRRVFSDGAIEPSQYWNHEGETHKFKRREREGIFKATPLLQAEGSREDVKRIVARTNSLRPIPGEANYREDSPRQGEDPRVKVQRLESENDILRERLQGIPNSSPRSSMANVFPKMVITMKEYRERYHQLEATALGKIKNALTHHLRHTNQKRQEQFTCALIQKSFDVSVSTVTQFKDIVKSLIMNPVNVNAATMISEHGRHRQGNLSRQIKILESFKPGHGINNNISKLAKKTLVGEEIPELLTRQVFEFLESMSEVTNIMDLVQNVTDELRSEYGDCITPALLNQSDFNRFLHDCCRLCWQMAVPEKPLYVCSNDHWRYEERHHVTDSNNGTTNARIDYYLWPILYSRISGGEVLYKGRVTLKL